MKKGSGFSNGEEKFHLNRYDGVEHGRAKKKDGKNPTLTPFPRLKCFFNPLVRFNLHKLYLEGKALACEEVVRV